jgi:hypothetical protein
MQMVSLTGSTRDTLSEYNCQLVNIKFSAIEALTHFKPDHTHKSEMASRGELTTPLFQTITDQLN